MLRQAQMHTGPFPGKEWRGWREVAKQAAEVFQLEDRKALTAALAFELVVQFQQQQKQAFGAQPEAEDGPQTAPEDDEEVDLGLLRGVDARVAEEGRRARGRALVLRDFSLVVKDKEESRRGRHGGVRYRVGFVGKDGAPLDDSEDAWYSGAEIVDHHPGGAEAVEDFEKALTRGPKKRRRRLVREPSAGEREQLGQASRPERRQRANGHRPPPGDLPDLHTQPQGRGPDAPRPAEDGEAAADPKSNDEVWAMIGEMAQRKMEKSDAAEKGLYDEKSWKTAEIAGVVGRNPVSGVVTIQVKRGGGAAQNVDVEELFTRPHCLPKLSRYLLGALMDRGVR